MFIRELNRRCTEATVLHKKLSKSISQNLANKLLLHLYIAGAARIVVANKSRVRALSFPGELIAELNMMHEGFIPSKDTKKRGAVAFQLI